jgi:hypothetical protein
VQSVAVAAEAALGVRIDNILSNVDPAALDSLTEVVQAFQDADSDIYEAIVNLANNITTNLNFEISSRIAGDQNLQNQVNAEESARIAADSSLQSALTSEESARIAGDASTLTSANSFATSAAAAVAIPVGTMHIFAGTVAPTGYLIANGSAVSRTTYSALFALVGTSFGSGNGSSTFNLPNPDTNVNLRYIIKF